MKRVVYKIRHYHFSEGEAFDALEDLIETLEQVLPGWDITYESCKSDYGHLTIEKEEKIAKL